MSAPRSAATKAARKRLRNPFHAGAIGHVKHGIDYHVANSLRGWRLMKRFGKKWADLDLQITADGVIIVCHWPKPGIHDGFVKGWGKHSRGMTVSHLTWADVQKLRTKDGYRIWSLEEAMTELGKLKLGAYLEPKGDSRLRSAAVWRQIRAMATKHGVKLRGYALRANADCLPFMRGVGIPCHELKH